MQKIDILAPTSSFITLQAAINAGADSIYFGLSELNMRSLTNHNFTIEDLSEIASICKRNKVKCYLTLNSIIYDQDLTLMQMICQKAKLAQIDAIIASDLAVIQYLNTINMSCHISTQLNVSNLEEVRFFSSFADTIVLARELSLKQIKAITTAIKKEEIKGPSGQLLKIEIFVHGALCVSISGKCYMSLALYNKSANRGQCLQPCRHSYKVTDLENEKELQIENKYVMSPKDLSTITVLDQIVDSGASILKIEGRARSPEYIATVTTTYKEALTSIQTNSYTQSKIKNWQEELKKVYNRGFWEGGYYLNQNLSIWSNSAGSKATQKRSYLGKAIKYYPKLQVGEFLLEGGDVKIGDEVHLLGPKIGLLKLKINSLHLDGPVQKAKKGQKVGVFIGQKIQKNDNLYLIHHVT